MSIILQRPWTRQPAYNTSVLSKYRAVYVHRLGAATVDDVSNRAPTARSTGAVFSGSSWLGTTFDSASGHYFNTGLSAHATQRTYIIRVRRTGDGSGGFGRIFDKLVSSSTVEAILNVGTGSTYQYLRAWSGGNVTWEWARPAASAWATIALAYDGSSTGNAPVVYVDGVKQTVTLTSSGASGSLSTNSDAYVLGNRLTDVGRGWDGQLADFCVLDSALTEGELARLSANPYLLYAPLPRRIWVPSAGTGVSVSTGVGALTISGLAPTVTQQIAVSTGVGALTITGQAPSASVGGGAAEATPSAGALTITTYAPTVTQQIAVQVNSGALVLSSSAPTIATGTQVSVGSAAMTLAGLAPTITQAIIVTPGPAALTLSAYAPSAELPDKVVSVDTAELIITGYGPTVDGGTVVQTATRGGGHHRRVKPRRYVVKIDDEEFIVASIAEAKKLISAAEEAAKEKADQAVAKVVSAGKKTKRKAIQEAREELRPPVIEIEGAIDLADDAEARIAEIYDSALAIARNVARRRDEDDDEDVLLLL